MISKQQGETLKLAKRLEVASQTPEWKAIIGWIVGQELAALDRMYRLYQTEKYPAQEDMALAGADYCQRRALRETLLANMVTAKDARQAIVDEVLKTYTELHGADRSAIEQALETE